MPGPPPPRWRGPAVSTPWWRSTSRARRFRWPSWPPPPGCRWSGSSRAPPTVSGPGGGARRVGTISAASCFSFYATKNLPIGEGGMLTTPDPAIAEFVRLARLHGMSRDAWMRCPPGGAWRYAVEVDGLKANMTDLQAAIGRAQLRHLDRWQGRRAELAAAYDGGLAGIPGLRTPHVPADG